jgi:hypothetical protein
MCIRWVFGVPFIVPVVTGLQGRLKEQGMLSLINMSLSRCSTREKILFTPVRPVAVQNRLGADVRQHITTRSSGTLQGSNHNLLVEPPARASRA